MSIRFVTKRRPPTTPAVVQPVPDPLDFLRLAHWIAGKFLTAYPDHARQSEDVRAEAVLGLMECCRLFDRKRGIKFITYASNGIYRYLQSWDHKKGGARHVDRLPPECKRAEGDKAPRNTVKSLHADLAYRFTVEETLSDRRGCLTEAMIDRDAAEHYLAVLDSRERRIIEWRLFDGLSLTKIGGRLGVSKERVRQLQVRALAKMRRAG